MSKELTEKFMNDKLDDRLYYFTQKMSQDNVEIGHSFALNMVRADDGEYLDWFLIHEVLSPVPTYDEYNELEKENRHLKSLLRKTKSSVRDTISVFKGKCIVFDGKYHEKHVKKFQDLLKKITEATKKKGVLKNME